MSDAVNGELNRTVGERIDSRRELLPIRVTARYGIAYIGSDALEAIFQPVCGSIQSSAKVGIVRHSLG